MASPFTPTAPVGLAAGTKQALPAALPRTGVSDLPYNWNSPRKLAPGQLEPLLQQAGMGEGFSTLGSAGTLRNADFARAGGNNAGAIDWGRLDGYSVGDYQKDNIGYTALRDSSGNIVATTQGPVHDSFNGSDYAQMASVIAAGVGGMYADGALGAGGAEAVSGMDLAADAAVGSGNNIFTAGSALDGAMTTMPVGGQSTVPGTGVNGSEIKVANPGPASGNTIGQNLLNGVTRNPLQTAALVSAMTSGSGGGAPVLDPTSAAAQQGAANKDASLFDTYLNRPDQITPQGSLKWTLKPGADPKNPQPGDWIQTTALNETGQQLYDADQALQLGMTGTSQAALGRVNDTLGQALDTSGLPAMGQVSNFTGADRQRIEDALMARLNPGFAQDEEAMRSRTLNTGFELGSEGSQREQFRLDQAKNDARLAAIAQSGQEAERLGNISRADASFQNQSRQQGLQEILAQRALPLNELNALRSGSQVQQPTFSPVSQSNTASAPVLDALMAQLSGQQANAANKQSGYNALLASLAQLGGSIRGD